MNKPLTHPASKSSRTPFGIPFLLMLLAACNAKKVEEKKAEEAKVPAAVVDEAKCVPSFAVSLDNAPAGFKLVELKDLKGEAQHEYRLNSFTFYYSKKPKAENSKISSVEISNEVAVDADKKMSLASKVTCDGKQDNEFTGIKLKIFTPLVGADLQVPEISTVVYENINGVKVESEIESEDLTETHSFAQLQAIIKQESKRDKLERKIKVYSNEKGEIEIRQQITYPNNAVISIIAAKYTRVATPEKTPEEVNTTEEKETATTATDQVSTSPTLISSGLSGDKTYRRHEYKLVQKTITSADISDDDIQKTEDKVEETTQSCEDPIPAILKTLTQVDFKATAAAAPPGSKYEIYSLTNFDTIIESNGKSSQYILSSVISNLGEKALDVTKDLSCKSMNSEKKIPLQIQAPQTIVASDLKIPTMVSFSSVDIATSVTATKGKAFPGLTFYKLLGAIQDGAKKSGAAFILEYYQDQNKNLIVYFNSQNGKITTPEGVLSRKSLIYYKLVKY